MDIIRINKYRKEIMGLATFWIFCFHFGPYIFAGSKWTLIKEVEWYIESFGYCGVEIFMFLSGMGLVYAIHKWSVKDFYIRRFMRVYTSFFVWFTLSTLVRDDKMTFLDYIKRITFYTNWAHDLLDYKWFIAAIMLLYLCFPAYYSLLKRIKRTVLFTLLLVLVEFCCSSIWYFDIRDDLFLILDRLPIFLVGVLLGHLMIESPDGKIWKIKWNKFQWIGFCIVVCTLSIVKYNFMLMETSEWLYNVENLTTSFLAVSYCLIAAKIFEICKRSRFMGTIQRALRFLGALSLEFYLTHELIGYKVDSFSLEIVPFVPVNKLLIFGIKFALGLIAAWMVLQISDILFRGKWKQVRNFFCKLDKTR